MTATTRTPAQQVAAAKRTKKYQALITTAGLAEDRALRIVMGQDAPVTDPLAPRINALVEAGFTEDEARQLLAEQPAEPTPQKAEPEVSVAEALVAQHGLTFTKGRVYGGVTLAEAIVRVSKTGTPEIVASSGVGRTAAVLVNRESSGDVSVQNLRRPV